MKIKKIILANYIAIFLVLLPNCGFSDKRIKKISHPDEIYYNKDTKTRCSTYINKEGKCISKLKFWFTDQDHENNLHCPTIKYKQKCLSKIKFLFFTNLFAIPYYFSN